MKIVVVGTGYVGLVTAVCLAEIGHQVICIDKNPDKITQLQQGKSPIFEPGIEKLLQQHLKNNTITFAVFDPTLIDDCDVLLIAVWTPMHDGNGSADLTAVYAVIEMYAPHLKNDTVIVIKSTVPIGTNQDLTNFIAAMALDKTLHLASNPEFLREGCAIQDFMTPDRIVVGATSDVALQRMRNIYQPFIDQKFNYIETDIYSAEMIKYASNAFLALKITFINEMADLCDQMGGNITEVAKGIGSDQRIGPLFLQPGPGYGGSCFPKDTRALTATAQSYQVPLSLIDQVIASNNARFARISDRIITLIKNQAKDQRESLKIGFLGLTFKANTDDVRDSPALEIIKRLRQINNNIHVYDPQAHDHTACDHSDSSTPPYHRCASIDEVLINASIVIIATEWDEFKLIHPQQFVTQMDCPCVYDLRNIFDPKTMHRAGINYHSIGRP